MKLQKIIITTIIATLVSMNSYALSSKDDCYVAVQELAQGIAKSYKAYDKKPAKVLNLELHSETEIRIYSLDLEHNGSIDSYSIQLENDFAFKCLMKQINPTEIGG